MATGVLCAPVYYLYRHIRDDTNEVFYVGMGTKEGKYIGYPTEFKRAYEKTKRSRFWKNIVDKTTYTVDIMYVDESLDLINAKEKEFIKLYGRRDLKTGSLVNLNEGGGSARGYLLTKEAKLKISNSLKGKPSRMKGRKHSEHTKKLMRKNHPRLKPSALSIQATILRSRGVKNHGAILTEEDVRSIRAKYSAGNCTQTMLAQEYKIDQGSISCIIRKTKWKHI